MEETFIEKVRQRTFLYDQIIEISMRDSAWEGTGKDLENKT
jgi:hypothetical protein